MRLSTAIAFFVAIALGLAIYQWNVAKRAEAHARARTRADIEVISTALKDLATADPSRMARPSLSNLDAHALYRLLVQTNNGVRVLQPRHRWDSTGELLDSWGRPFSVRVSFIPAHTNAEKTETISRWKLWSVGPNGKDEDGGGDDISSDTFDIPLYE